MHKVARIIMETEMRQKHREKTKRRKLSIQCCSISCKCLSVLGTQEFQQLDVSPTAANETKIQRAQRKMKSKFTLPEHKILYPTRSNAGKLYGTAKLRKLPTLGTVD